MFFFLLETRSQFLLLQFLFTWISHKCVHQRIFEVVRCICIVVVVLLVHCVNFSCFLKQAAELLDFDCRSNFVFLDSGRSFFEEVLLK